MPEFSEDLIATRRPTPERPLLGQTVLVVEDSRFACEAMRLLCLRSGARIRRADSLRAAARHLAVYRPSVVVIDLGLPDGSGLSLIRDLARAQPRVPVILATSGDPALRAQALSAGAHDFIAKPLTTIAVFQAAILAHLPPDERPSGPRPVATGKVLPDAIALRDDLAHAAELPAGAPDAATVDYALQFLGGLAVSAGDAALEDAARDVSRCRASGARADAATERLTGLIGARLSLAEVV